MYLLIYLFTLLLLLNVFIKKSNTQLKYDISVMSYFSYFNLIRVSFQKYIYLIEIIKMSVYLASIVYFYLF